MAASHGMCGAVLFWLDIVWLRALVIYFVPCTRHREREGGIEGGYSLRFITATSATIQCMNTQAV